jgi:TolB protein
MFYTRFAPKIVSPIFLVLVLNLSGCSKLYKVDPLSPSPAPTGERILYATHSTFVTVKPDGTGGVAIDSHGGIEPNLSPNRKRIVFSRPVTGFDYDLWIMNTDGTGLTQLTDGNFTDVNSQWSPDGSKVVFTRAPESGSGVADVYIISVSTHALVKLSNNTSNWVSQYPSWSPDGSKVSFHWYCNIGDIFTINTDGTALTNATNNPGDYWYPRWSPDGTQFVYWSWTDLGYDVYKMNLDGTGSVNLTNLSDIDDQLPYWSPDGSRIVFASNRDGDGEIYTMKADGTDIRRITNNMIDDGYPSWR